MFKISDAVFVSVSWQKVFLSPCHTVFRLFFCWPLTAFYTIVSVLSRWMLLYITLSFLDTDFSMGKYLLGKVNTVEHKINLLWIFIYLYSTFIFVEMCNLYIETFFFYTSLTSPPHILTYLYLHIHCSSMKLNFNFFSVCFFCLHVQTCLQK